MDVFLYRTIIFIHVLGAIGSIGPFFILLLLVRKLRVARDTELAVYIDTFRFTVRLTKHAGHVLVGSGVILVLFGPWTWSTPWIVMTLILLFGSLFFLARAFSPKLKKFQETDHNRDELIKKINRSVWTYLLLLLAMLWFMITKPTLW